MSIDKIPSSERPEREMLKERFDWLLFYNKQVPMRLLVQASVEHSFVDVIDFIYADYDNRSQWLATLFEVPATVLFSPVFISREDFAARIEYTV